ncbi:hypothetical protein B0T20DRAFT_502053 [Sordaria brevicollis]|uniref:Uncharacterized protein n=1 Tax=Sordaria brevicollis TaxID=83679 RepID=A0AAE0UA34_SORBR|nr:hypothetical protein B0T20DRAFT_502053 [Sordaria brevicollis]
MSELPGEPASEDMDPEQASATGASPAAMISEKQHNDVQQDRSVDDLPTQPRPYVHPDRRAEGRSPSPLADERMVLWQDENRGFKGLIDRNTDRQAYSIATALAAQRSPLVVDGQPQFVFFCDGSSAYRPRRAYKDGGYAVVFRDPYDTDKAVAAGASEAATAGFEDSREEDGIKVGDFTIRHWLSHKTYGANYVELAAIAQSLEEAIQRIDQHQPERSVVKVFTDSTAALVRIERSIANGDLVLGDTTNGRAIFFNRNRDIGTEPFVRLVIWQSHYLADRGCTVELHWLPRNTTLAHRLADHMAGLWKNAQCGKLFNQGYLPHHERDGLLDKLHAEVSSIRAKDPRLAFDLERQTGQKRKRRSTKNFILLDSDSDDEPLPLPHPKRQKQAPKVAINTPMQATGDFIPLESDSEDDPANQPRSRRAWWYKLMAKKELKKRLSAEKKAGNVQEDVPVPTQGFLNGEDYAFNFDSSTLPAYPVEREQGDNDADSSTHNRPGCPLCQADASNDLHPWMSGYTGLPSQWTLRRY